MALHGEINENKPTFISVTEQDQGLEVLSSVIARQKQMGETIGDELEQHNGVYTHFIALFETMEELFVVCSHTLSKKSS